MSGMLLQIPLGIPGVQIEAFDTTAEKGMVIR